MKTNDLISMGLRNLWRRKLRTVLTVIGVVIGATSIVVMVSLGMAQQQQFDAMIDTSRGLTTVNVSPSQYFDPSVKGAKAPRTGIITDKVIEEIQKIPGVKKVVYFTNLGSGGSTKINMGKYTVGAQIQGMDADALESAGITIAEGRSYHSKTKDIEVVVSSELKYSLYDEKSPKSQERFWEKEIDYMKERFKLTIGNVYSQNTPLTQMEGQEVNTKKKTYNLKVVGVTTPSMMSSSMGIYTSRENIDKLKDEINSLTMTPADYKASKKNKTQYYENITVHVNDMKDIDGVMQKLQSMDLNAYSDSEWINQAKSATNTVQIILAGIGSISLIVAAIGITNTMVMSIYERTREIGVMKVIGASVQDIRNLFLFEAGMIGFFGGAVGVLLSYGVSGVINGIAGGAGGGGMMGMGGKASVIPPWLALAALVFSFVIGVVTGYYPARRATKLSAIEAIRTE
ncbi:MAG: ABC transporter permease [Tissierellia bacterium]|nr:ABC transporter permease [Tissierellia bacterium]